MANSSPRRDASMGTSRPTVHPRASSQTWLTWLIEHEAMPGLPRNVTSDSSKTPQDWHGQVKLGNQQRMKKRLPRAVPLICNKCFIPMKNHKILIRFMISNGPFQCTHHGNSSNLVAYPKMLHVRNIYLHFS